MSRNQAVAVFKVAILGRNHSCSTKVHRQARSLLESHFPNSKRSCLSILHLPNTHSNTPTVASSSMLSDEKATHSEVSHEDEERIAAWTKAEKERVRGWEGSERHRINGARRTCGDAEAEKALERMRKEVASAYERIEKERDAALERAKN